MTKRRLEIPGSIWSAAEWSQRLEDTPIIHPYKALRRFFTASNSTAFEAVRFEKVADVRYFGSPRAVTIQGDPEAGFLPKNWNNSAIIRVGSVAIESLRDQILDFDGDADPHPAVAYQRPDGWRAGIISEFGQIEDGEDPAGFVYAAAMRRGRNDFQVQIGWKDTHNTLWVPPGVHIKPASVMNDQLAGTYPGVRLA